MFSRNFLCEAGHVIKEVKLRFQVPIHLQHQVQTRAVGGSQDQLDILTASKFYGYLRESQHVFKFEAVL